MSEKITLKDTDTEGIIWTGVDKNGIKTGPITTGLTVTIDQPAIASVTPLADGSGTYSVVPIVQTVPIDAPTVKVTATLDSDPTVTDEVDITIAPGAPVSIAAELTDNAPAAPAAPPIIPGNSAVDGVVISGG